MTKSADKYLQGIKQKTAFKQPQRLLKCRFLYFVKIAFLVAYQVLSSASLCIWYVLQEVRYGAVQRFTYKIQLLKAHTLRKLIIEMADRCGPYTSLFGQPCLRPTPVSEDTRQMIFDHRIALTHKCSARGFVASRFCRKITPGVINSYKPVTLCTQSAPPLATD